MKNTIPLVKKLILAAAFVALVGNLVGCRNTARGFGQDVEHTGEKIQQKTE
jgi:predicted small secreted protein